MRAGVIGKKEKEKKTSQDTNDLVGFLRGAIKALLTSIRAVVSFGQMQLHIILEDGYNSNNFGLVLKACTVSYYFCR